MEEPAATSPQRQRQRLAAYGLCLNGRGEVLLARGAAHLTVAGRWFLPGGGVDHGEAPAAALEREVAEETGLQVEVGPLLEVLSDVATLPDGTELHTVRVIYRITAWRGMLRPEAEGSTDEARWVAVAEARQLPIMPYVASVLDRWVKPAP